MNHIYFTKFDELIGQIVLTAKERLSVVSSCTFDGEPVLMEVRDASHDFCKRYEMVKSFGTISEESRNKLLNSHFKLRSVKDEVRAQICEEVKAMDLYSQASSELSSFRLPAWYAVPYITKDLVDTLQEEIRAYVGEDSEKYKEEAIIVAGSSDLYLANVWEDMWMYIPDKVKKMAVVDEEGNPLKADQISLGKKDLLKAFVPRYVSKAGPKRICDLVDVGDEMSFLEGYSPAFDVASFPVLDFGERVSKFRNALDEAFGDTSVPEKVLESGAEQKAETKKSSVQQMKLF